MRDDLSTPITWVSHSQLEVDKTNGVQVWKCSISRNIPFLLACYPSVLSEEEWIKSKLFFRETDRKSYLTRRILIRLLLAKPLCCLASEIRFREGKNKKPEVSYPSTEIHFNISHSGDYILIAFAKKPIGIDIEKVNPLFQYQDIMDQYFTLDEQNFIVENKKEALNNFFFLWTRKEAYLKYTAEGLLGDLVDMPALINLPDNMGVNGKENSHFHVRSALLADGYYMSLIYPATPSEVHYFEYDYSAPISTLPLLLEV